MTPEETTREDVMKAILHNYYILESDGAANYTVYSGPSAKKQICKTFKGEKALEAAKKFQRMLP